MKTPGALRDLAETFEFVADQLRSKTASTHAYSLVSSRTTKAFNSALGNWISSGHSGPPPNANSVELRAEIYGFGRPASDARAYRAVFLTMCLEFAEVGLLSLRRGRIAVPMTISRSLIERISVASNVVSVTSLILRKSSAGPLEIFESLTAAGEHFAIALHGTKLDWQKVGQQSVVGIDPKRARYTPLNHSLDLSAKQILGHIDKLDRVYPGARVAYEIMCEFLHPNVGDFYSSILDAGSSTDWLGSRHLDFAIGQGPPNFENTPDLDVVMAQAIQNAKELVALIPQIDRDLRKIADTICWRTRKLIRPLIKQYPSLFAKSDKCPCQSGNFMINCCAT